jgi:DNA-directed RNA polymerase subunit A'
MLVPEKTRDEIYDIETLLIKDAKLITRRLEMGEIIPPIDKTVLQFYEEMIVNKMQIMDDFLEPLLSAVNSRTNNLFKLATCGSKGKISQIHHIMSSIGQVLIKGQRIKQTFSYGRSHPYFPRFDMSPKAHGYIANSYMTGMSPIENVFNSMAARFDLISKALTTSVAGETGRKCIKNLETCIVNNLYNVVKGNNVIQLIYGEDGYEPRLVEQIKYPTLFMSNADLDNFIIDVVMPNYRPCLMPNLRLSAKIVMIVAWRCFALRILM